LNSDGQQSTNTNKLNNYLSHQTIEHQDDPAMWHWKTGGSGLGQAQKCGRVKLLMGSQPFSLDNWISNDKEKQI